MYACLLFRILLPLVVLATMFADKHTHALADELAIDALVVNAKEKASRKKVRIIVTEKISGQDSSQLPYIEPLSSIGEIEQFLREKFGFSRVQEKALLWDYALRLEINCKPLSQDYHVNDRDVQFGFSGDPRNITLYTGAEATVHVAMEDPHGRSLTRKSTGRVEPKDSVEVKKLEILRYGNLGDRYKSQYEDPRKAPCREAVAASQVWEQIRDLAEQIQKVK